MNLGKAKALHVAIEKRWKLGTLDMLDSYRKTWHAIDNKSLKDEMDDIGKTPQLKKNLKYKTKLTPNSSMLCTQDFSNKQYSRYTVIFRFYSKIISFFKFGSQSCETVVVDHC